MDAYIQGKFHCSLDKNMALVLNFGLTVQSILVNGLTVKLKDQELSTIQMVTYLWENSKMIKQMEVENMYIGMAKLMKVNGSKICNTVKVKKTCLMEVHFQDFFKKVVKMEMASIDGLTTRCTKACGRVEK